MHHTHHRTWGQRLGQELTVRVLQVSYWRIPMNAEHFASHEAIDTFVDMVKSIDDQTHFVFNCQMGKHSIRKSCVFL